MKTYAFDLAERKAVTFSTRRDAVNHGNGFLVFANEEELSAATGVSLSALTELYNKMSPIKVASFRDRPSAVKKLFALAQAKAIPFKKGVDAKENSVSNGMAIRNASTAILNPKGVIMAKSIKDAIKEVDKENENMDRETASHSFVLTAEILAKWKAEIVAETLAGVSDFIAKRFTRKSPEPGANGTKKKSGRASAFDGRSIILSEGRKTNPYREGTEVWRVFEHILDRKESEEPNYLYSEFLSEEVGGKWIMLNGMLKHGYVTVDPPLPPKPAKTSAKASGAAS